MLELPGRFLQRLRTHRRARRPRRGAAPGDFLYEYDAAGYAAEQAAQLGRVVEPAGELLVLADYRLRHAQYRRDPDAQAMHAALPMIAVWDDHEIANDTWTGGAENHDAATEDPWLARRAAGIRAHAAAHRHPGVGLSGRGREGAGSRSLRCPTTSMPGTGMPRRARRYSASPAWTNELADAAGQAVGVEFATPSASRRSSPTRTRRSSPARCSGPLVYADTRRRGYLVVTATPSEMKAQWRYVDTIATRGGSATLGRTLRTHPGAGQRRIVEG